MHVYSFVKKQLKFLGFLLILLFSKQAFSAALMMQGILEDTVTGPIPSVTVGTVSVSVKTHDGACTLYSEQHVSVNVDANAKFMIQLGSGSVLSNPYSVSSIEETFINDNRFNSSPCLYSPPAGQTRQIVAVFSGGTLLSPITLSMNLGHSPFSATAYFAETSKATSAVGSSSEQNLLRVPGVSTTPLSPSQYTEFTSLLAGSSANYMKATPISAVSFNSQKITNLADPTLSQDAVTKIYSDSKLAGKSLPAPSIADDQKFIRWNNGSNTWEYAATAAAGISSVAPASGSPVTVSGTTAIQLGLNTGTALEVVAGNVQVKIGASCSSGNYAYWSSVSGAFECAPLAVANNVTPGIVSIVAQSFAGIKTFINDVVVNGNLNVGGTITGSLSGTASNALAIAGRTVSSNTPSDGDVLTWHSGSSTWKPMAPSGGAGGMAIFPVSGTTFSVSATTHKGSLLDVTNPDAVLTLPSASSAGAGYEVTIAGPNTGAPFVQINATGGDLVGSAAGATLVDKNASIRLVSNGTRWIPLALVNAVMGVGTLGMLDISLNGTGYKPFNFNQYIYQVVLDSSKKIYYADANGLNFNVYRRNADSTVDTSFDSDGMGTTSLSAVDFQYVNYSSMAVAPNGKIFVVGSVYSTGTYIYPYTTLPIILAFNSNGSVDTSFNSVGYWVGTGNNPYFNRVVIDSNNKPIALGSENNGTYPVAKMWKFTTTGALDGSFASGGILSYDVGFYNGFQETAIDASDNIYTFTSYSDGSVNHNEILKYNSSGSLVAGFGSGGKINFVSPAYPSTSVYPSEMKLDSSGNLFVVSGFYVSSDNYLAIYKINGTSGTYDSSFSGDGEFYLGMPPDDLYGKSMSFDGSGRILVTGSKYGGMTSDDMAVWRINANGTIDTTFSDDGMFTHDGAKSPNSYDGGYAVYEDGSGRIVVVGKSSYMSSSDIYMWRIR